MEIGDNKGLFRLLRKEGRRKSEIAPIILTHFVKSAGTSALKSAPSSPVRKPLRGKDSDDEDDDDEVDEEEDADSLDGEGKWDDVLEALSIIERDASLSPMEVINILAQNPQLPLSVCFDYTRRYLQATQSEAATTAGLVDNMRSVVSHAEDELEALKKKVWLLYSAMKVTSDLLLSLMNSCLKCRRSCINLEGSIGGRSSQKQKLRHMKTTMTTMMMMTRRKKMKRMITT
jgi:hypothetical protein